MTAVIGQLFLFAHHALWIAVPFVVPPLILIAGLLFLTMRDRRSHRGESQ